MKKYIVYLISFIAIFSNSLTASATPPSADAIPIEVSGRTMFVTPSKTPPRSGWVASNRLTREERVGLAGKPIDMGKQGKHIPGHPHHVSTKTSWLRGGGILETNLAVLYGTEYSHSDGSVRFELKFDYEVGTKGEKGVRVHMNSRGIIHGYPVYIYEPMVLDFGDDSTETSPSDSSK